MTINYKLIRSISLMIFAAAALGSAKAVLGNQPEQLLREGNAAFWRGDYSQAINLFEKAQARTTDPGAATMNLAAARFRAGEFEESARLYLCCTGKNDPRRAKALLGVGNSLLQKVTAADAGNRDRKSLRVAIRCFRKCEKEAVGDPVLQDSAGHNLQMARLLLAQTPDPESGEEPNYPDQDPEKEDSSPDPKTGDPGTEGKGKGKRADNGSAAEAVETRPGENVEQADGSPAPGKGNLPVIPDQSEPSPLDAKEAAEHLNRAARRILEERLLYRKNKSTGAVPSPRNW
jgi:tetratricopeptide (TPR) repeat protein